MRSLNLEETKPVKMVANYSAIFLIPFVRRNLQASLPTLSTDLILIYHCSTDTADFTIASYLSVIHIKIKLWTTVMKIEE